MNHDTAPVCVRCRTPLAPARAERPAYGAPLEVAYPYAAPSYGAPYTAFGETAGVWRDGATLVMHKRARLPDRCVKCNAPVYGRRVNRQLWYMHPALYVLAVSPVIFLVVYLCVRKGAKIDVGVCEAHVDRRRNLLAAGWCLLGLGILSFMLAAYIGSAVPFLVGFVVLLSSVFVLALGNRLVAPAKVDDQYVWLRGVSAEYLGSLPPMR